MELAVCTLADVAWFRLLKTQDQKNPDPNLTNEVSMAARTTILAQVLQGLAYLKSKRIIHRDLKPDNVLLTSVGTSKLCDFGLSIFVPDGEDSVVIKDKRGTPEFMAPELYCNVQRIDYGTDVWSFGLLLYTSYTTGKAFLTNTGRRFSPKDWEAYREGNTMYFYEFINYSAVELECIVMTI